MICLSRARYLLSPKNLFRGGRKNSNARNPERPGPYPSLPGLATLSHPLSPSFSETKNPSTLSPGNSYTDPSVLHSRTNRLTLAPSAPLQAPELGRFRSAHFTLFHKRSPTNMKPLFVTKSEPTMLIAVDRLPENTRPEICAGAVRQ